MGDRRTQHTGFDKVRRGGRRARTTPAPDLPEIEIIELDDPPEPLNPRLDRAPPVADTRAGRGWRAKVRSIVHGGGPGNCFRGRRGMPLR